MTATFVQWERLGEAVRRRPLSAILNSRQSKRPCGADPWVTSTSSAVRELVNGGAVFLTSVGLNTWELLVYLVNEYGGEQIILLPQSESEVESAQCNYWVEQFRLKPEHTIFSALPSTSGLQLNSESCQQLRDRHIISKADVLVPISVRRRGLLATLISETDSTRGKLVEKYRIDYAEGIDHPKYDFSLAKLNKRFTASDWNHIVHWTRSSHGRYPDERLSEYYSDIVNSAFYPRSAWATLRRILEERKIRASHRFIRGKFDVVSFSELNPADAVKLMRWRSRYVYYSFEPYGIAIEREYALKMGCRPAIYGSPEDYQHLAACDKPLFQNSGSKGSDWRPEGEWRHAGNLDLYPLDRDKVIAITHSPCEADSLRSVSPFEVISLLAE